jgi:hypothetical protein
MRAPAPPEEGHVETAISPFRGFEGILAAGVENGRRHLEPPRLLADDAHRLLLPEATRRVDDLYRHDGRVFAGIDGKRPARRGELRRRGRFPEVVHGDRFLPNPAGRDLAATLLELEINAVPRLVPPAAQKEDESPVRYRGGHDDRRFRALVELLAHGELEGRLLDRPVEHPLPADGARRGEPERRRRACENESSGHYAPPPPRAPRGIDDLVGRSIVAGFHGVKRLRPVRFRAHS